MHRSQSQKAMLNIVKFKKLYIDFINRIEGHKRLTTEIKSYKIDEKVYL